MLTIYTNVKTKKHYDAYGDFFPNGMPRVFFKARETVVWQLCSETPEDTVPDTFADESESGSESESQETQWKPYTGYADYSSIGAYLTADSDFRLKRPGVLKVAIDAGPAATVVADVDGATYALIPETGVITLFSTDGTTETGNYTSRTISNGTVTFTMAEDTEFAKSYPANTTEMDCYESYYMQASLDTVASDTANGRFVFHITAFSEKLRRAIVYSDVKELPISALEMAIFTIDENDNAVQDLERYMVDTFTIRAGLADTSMEVPVTSNTENEIVTLTRTLLAGGYEMQFSSDGSNWHDSQSVGTDTYFHFRNAAIGGNWGGAVRIVNGADGNDGTSDYVYVGFAADSSGTSFSTSATDDLKYRAEIHTSSAIVTPTSSDFVSAAWVKYLGDDGAPGSNGSNGSDGLTPVLAMGTVTTLSAGASATASIDGTAPNFSLNLGIPRGSDGQGGGGTVTWGGIGGALSDQTDLQSAFNNKQDKIDSNNKLPYSNLSGTPTIGSGTLTISSGGTAVIFNANQTSNASVTIPTPGSGVLTISSGGSTYTFNANQTSNTTVDLGSGGGGGSSTVYNLGSSGGYVSLNYSNGDYQYIYPTGDLYINSDIQNLPVGGGMVLEIRDNNNGYAVSVGANAIISSGSSGNYLIGFFRRAGNTTLVFQNAAKMIPMYFD